MNDILEEIRRQAHWSGEFGSAFTQQLLQRAGDDLAAGGAVAKLVEGWGGNPRADAVSLRIAGALHAAALTGRDAALAAEYPAARPDWSMDRVWPLARDFLDRESDWVRGFLRSPPQTNETARAAGLAAGFMWLAARAPQPFHMLELGGSAGLNLNWDRFAYTHPAWGREDVAGPLIPTRIDGAAPDWRSIDIASRAACDQNPLDPSDPDHRLRLTAYVWADQTPRLERLRAAMDMAAAAPWRVERADAADWIAARLAGGLKAGTTVVYHSVFLQYPPKAVQRAIADAIESAGALATPDHRLAWVRFEPEAILGGPAGGARYVLNVVTWDGAACEAATLAEVDPHGRTMNWLAA